MPRRWMHHQPRGFVDHYHMLILEQNVEGQRLWRPVNAVICLGGNLKFVTRHDLVARTRKLSIAR